ncbi:MAG: class I SAM-dependent methyltransferase [Roseicyclus sp.]|nr:class I SAM-dependent methyltransferase [Roseicyclus sp.]
MTRRLELPDTPGTAVLGDARMSAPSALRNRDLIAAELLRVAPARGRALEIASGTGEHVIRFAEVMPGLTWQPTDPDPLRRASIAAWTGQSGLDNIRPPLDLDAARVGWAEEEPLTADLVVVVNLLHLISGAEAETVLTEIAAVLSPGGVFALYGPFLRDGEATSEGDAAFHASLKAQDPAIGYKDVIDTCACLVEAGLAHVETVAMPANNLLLVFERSDVA